MQIDDLVTKIADDLISSYFKEADQKLIEFYGSFESAKQACLNGRVSRYRPPNLNFTEKLYADGVLIHEIDLGVFFDKSDIL